MVGPLISPATVGSQATLFDVPPSNNPGNAWSQRFRAGDLVGRYVVRGILGAGGMGVVLEAYDPMLDRRVALKLLHVGANVDRKEHQGRTQDSAQASATDNDRGQMLLREAHGMAQLSHPHIIPVYDVGWIDNALFLAMELHVGDTLGGWIRAKKRAWQDVVRVMIQAASGLAAIHARGLIHCDIKPSNLLVDRLGNLRIADFGLAARVDEIRQYQGPTFGLADFAHEPTEFGNRKTRHAGTLAYMAPEQHQGARLDPRCDQFAYFVTLYEVLGGRRPFHGESHEGLLQAIIRTSHAQSLAPPTRRLPAWLQRALQRGLAADPDDRFADMQQVESTLQAGLQESRRQRVILPSAAALTLAMASGGVALAQQAEDPCDALLARPLAVWNDEVQSTLHNRFMAAQQLDLQSSWDNLRSALQNTIDTWHQAALTTCRNPDAAHAEVTQRCLDGTLAGVRSATQVLLSAPEYTLVDPHAVLSAVPDPHDCVKNQGRAASALPWPDQPAAQKAVAKLREKITHIEMQGRTGQLQAMMASYAATKAEALKIGYLPALAELEFQVGLANMWFFEVAKAQAHLHSATLAAQASGHSDISAWALTEQIFDATGYAIDETTYTERAELARAAVVRAGDPPLLLAEWLNNAGIRDMTSGKFSHAQAKFQLSNAMAGNLRGRTYLGREDRLNNLAIVAQTIGDIAGGEQLLRQALQPMAPRLGEAWHPRASTMLSNLGRGAMMEGRYQEAHYWLFESLRSTPRVDGRITATADTSCGNLQLLYFMLGRLDQTLLLRTTCPLPSTPFFQDRRGRAAYSALPETQTLAAQGYLHAARMRHDAFENELKTLPVGPQDIELFVAYQRYFCADAAQRTEQAFEMGQEFSRLLASQPSVDRQLYENWELTFSHTRLWRELGNNDRSQTLPRLRRLRAMPELPLFKTAYTAFRQNTGPSNPMLIGLAVMYLEQLEAAGLAQEYSTVLASLLRERDYWAKEVPRQQVFIDAIALRHAAAQRAWQAASTHLTDFIAVRDLSYDDPRLLQQILSEALEEAKAGQEAPGAWLVALEAELAKWQHVVDERINVPFSPELLQSILDRARRDASNTSSYSLF